MLSFSATTFALQLESSVVEQQATLLHSKIDELECAAGWHHSELGRVLLNISSGDPVNGTDTVRKTVA